MEQFKEFLATVKFQNARTWKSFAPHEYIIKNKLPLNQQKIFDKIMKYIQEEGYTTKFLKKTYRYTNYNGYRYWIDIAKGDVFILNRTEEWREFK